MHWIATSIAATGLLAGLTSAQPPPRHYVITDLGTLPGGAFSQATFVTDDSTIAGVSTAADGTQHGVLWKKGHITDISAPGLGGPNSGVFSVNERGQALGQAESSVKDPHNENFCAYGTGLVCLPVLWNDGAITRLPTLGGNNGTVGAINNRGEAVGVVENRTQDPDCPAGVTITGAGPLVFDFEAVIWGPAEGEMRELRPLAGDTVAMALWINDSGQAVGVSGKCSNSLPPPLALGPHAVLWERDGSIIDLGNFGGTADPAAGVGHAALAISADGQVVGASVLKSQTATHAFLWSREAGMRDLGTLPGAVNSAGLGINERGEVVGASYGAAGPFSGSSRAFFWQNGVMTDLNTLVAGGSSLSLTFAGVINSRSEIVGFGLTSTGDVHGFLATPAPTTASAGPKDSTVITRQIMLDGTASFSADGQPMSYVWSIPQGSPSASILQGNTATPTIQFGSSRGVYTFQLTVTDSSGASSSDVTTVNFQGN